MKRRCCCGFFLIRGLCPIRSGNPFEGACPSVKRDSDSESSSCVFSPVAPQGFSTHTLILWRKWELRGGKVSNLNHFAVHRTCEKLKKKKRTFLCSVGFFCMLDRVDICMVVTRFLLIWQQLRVIYNNLYRIPEKHSFQKCSFQNSH